MAPLMLASAVFVHFNRSSLGRPPPVTMAVCFMQSSNRTWVEVLAVHGIRPWTPVHRWSLPLRKARAWARLRAWEGPASRIRWRAACGTFDGRATLGALGKRA
jgi:hypothetical protein